jgi:ribosome-binding factor A
MNHNKERFSSLLKKEIALFLERNFPRDNGIFLSVTKVRLSGSLEKADVFVSIFPDERAEKTIVLLRRFKGDVMDHIASKIRARKIPNIIFVLDKTQGAEISLEKSLENLQDK